MNAPTRLRGEDSIDLVPQSPQSKALDDYNRGCSTLRESEILKAGLGEFRTEANWIATRLGRCLGRGCMRLVRSGPRRPDFEYFSNLQTCAHITRRGNGAELPRNAECQWEANSISLCHKIGQPACRSHPESAHWLNPWNTARCRRAHVSSRRYRWSPTREAPPFTLRVFSGDSSVYVGVSPANVSLVPNQKQQFFAVVIGTANTGVTWSATAGSIDKNGLYTAPASSRSINVTVTAVSNADSSRTASALITIGSATTSQPLVITTAGLAQGQVRSSYQQALSASGGTPPYTWHIPSGNPPTGVSLSSDGQLSGMPTATGTFNFTVSVTDSRNLSAQQAFAVAVTSSSNFDGPAELPRVTMSTSMTSTPAPGKTISVNAGDNLQLALNNAACGDTVALQEGATFTGTFQFPAKPCDDNRWIVVRTSAPDGALPAEGQRITPCYAGVASLFGRPQYACSNPQNVMARIVVNNSELGPISFASGANHYRLIGLEITRATGLSAPHPVRAGPRRDC